MRRVMRQVMCWVRLVMVMRLAKGSVRFAHAQV